MLDWIAVVAFAAFTSGVLYAQEPGYRIEMSRDAGGSVRMAFLNRSAKDIDAFHTAIECPSYKQRNGGDVLGSPHGGDRIRAWVGGWDGGPALEDQGQVCRATVDAVIYSDGSFDGPEEIVRFMHAAREGGYAAIRGWERFLATLHAHRDAQLSDWGEHRIKEDRSHLQNCRRFGSPAETELNCAYWSGRLHSEIGIFGWWEKVRVAGDGSNYIDLETYLRDWKEKYDNDISFIELSRSFVPVSPR